MEAITSFVVAFIRDLRFLSIIMDSGDLSLESLYTLRETLN